MTGRELGNCRRYGWDPVVLVFSNGADLDRPGVANDGVSGVVVGLELMRRLTRPRPLN